MQAGLCAISWGLREKGTIGFLEVLSGFLVRCGPVLGSVCTIAISCNGAVGKPMSVCF